MHLLPYFSAVRTIFSKEYTGTGLLMRLIGPLFVIFFYAMLSIHVYTHLTVVLFVLKKRLGVLFGLIWVAIGVSLLYNIVYNHFFAMIVKPGGPKDLKVRDD